MLLRELWCVDATDVVADEAVKAYFRWMEECENWSKLSSFEQMVIPYSQAPLVMREDCSTGIGQMHAFVAIDANNLEGEMFIPFGIAILLFVLLIDITIIVKTIRSHTITKLKKVFVLSLF